MARVVEAGIAVVCWGEVHEVINGEAVCGKLGTELGTLRRADDGDRGWPVYVVPYVGLNLLELIERDVCEGGSLVLLPPEVEAKNLIALLGDRLCLLVSRRALGASVDDNGARVRALLRDKVKALEVGALDSSD